MSQPYSDADAARRIEALSGSMMLCIVARWFARRSLSPR